MYISTPPSPEVENFRIKIYYPAGDRTPDLLNQRQTCYHLNQRGDHSTGSWWAFSAGQRTSKYRCCDTTCSSWCTTTGQSNKNPRSLANWTRMEDVVAGSYSSSRACHNHCRIATTGARYLVQSIAGWHSAPLWPFEWENMRLRCNQRAYTVY